MIIHFHGEHNHGSGPIELTERKIIEEKLKEENVNRRYGALRAGQD